MTGLVNAPYIPLILIFFTGSALVLFRPGSRMVFILTVQYLSVSWLVFTNLPSVGVVVKMITGCLVCFILYLGIRQTGISQFEGIGQRIFAYVSFRVVALLLVMVASISIASSNLFVQFNISLEANLGATFLIATSLLNLGLGSDQLRNGIGLLTLISGGELIYSYIEPSLAVIALLAMVQLGIVLVLCYIMSIRVRYGMLENPNP